MKLLVIILNHTESLNTLMGLMVEWGVRGATLLESEGMGRILQKDAPLFALHGDKLQGVRPYNRTILSVVEDDLAQRVLDKLEREVELGDSVGVAFWVPVGGFVKLKPL